MVGVAASFAYRVVGRTAGGGQLADRNESGRCARRLFAGHRCVEETANQLARIANTYGEADAASVEEMTRIAHEVWKDCLLYTSRCV